MQVELRVVVIHFIHLVNVVIVTPHALEVGVG
jgi:hypothetical protein